MMDELSEHLEYIEKELHKGLHRFKTCDYSGVDCRTCSKIRAALAQKQEIERRQQEKMEAQRDAWRECEKEIEALNLFRQMYAGSRILTADVTEAKLRPAYHSAINAAAALEKLLNMRGQGHE